MGMNIIERSSLKIGGQKSPVPVEESGPGIELALPP
jgi:hypothetical protein